jgi:guanylate kinase
MEQLDPELQNFFTDLKQGIRKDYAKYFQAHPEIRQVLNDFLSTLLLHKPDNTYNFAKDYFKFYNQHKEAESLKPLIIVGPSGSGKV